MHLSSSLIYLGHYFLCFYLIDHCCSSSIGHPENRHVTVSAVNLIGPLQKSDLIGSCNDSYFYQPMILYLRNRKPVSQQQRDQSRKQKTYCHPCQPASVPSESSNDEVFNRYDILGKFSRQQTYDILLIFLRK